MLTSDYIARFSDHLFWDVSRKEIDLETNASFLVKRVLEYGLIEDWLLLRSLYGIPKIASIAQRLRSLEPRALAFICALSNTSKTEYRCFTTKQLNPQHWSY